MNDWVSKNKIIWIRSKLLSNHQLKYLVIEEGVQSYSVKKAFLEISQNSQENTWARVSVLKKRFWERCFPVNFSKFLRKPFLTEHHRWLLLAFQSESTLYSFKTFCSKQAQYLKFKLTVASWKHSRSNKVQGYILASVKILKNELYHRPLSEILIVSSTTYHFSFLFKLFLNYLIFIV